MSEVSIFFFGISCFKKSKLKVTGEKWALNTCTGKLTSGDLPIKSVVKLLPIPTFPQLFTVDVKHRPLSQCLLLRPGVKI